MAGPFFVSTLAVDGAISNSPLDGRRTTWPDHKCSVYVGTDAENLKKTNKQRQQRNKLKK